MSKIEAIFVWGGIWLYGFGFISFLYGIVFKRESWLRVGGYISLAGFTLHTLSMGLRWLQTGHPPVVGVYENSLLGAWFMMMLFIMTRSWQRRLEVIGVVVLPLVFLMIGNGIMTADSTHKQWDVHFKSNWLWLHVFFAWVSYGAFCVAAGLGTLYLLKERFGRKGNGSRFYDMISEIGVINEVTLKVVMFGFIALTVEIGAGALWAYDLWGRYWGWDPVETWSLITWLVYGTYIHLAVTLGWKGTKMAWLSIFALMLVFMTFGGIGFISGIHTPVL